MTLAIIFPVTSTVTGGDEIPLTVALYRVLRSGVTVNENDPSAAVVVPATAVTAVNGYGLAYSSTDEPASAPDGALPDSVAGSPLATVAGRTVKLVADVPGDWYEPASAPVGTANNAATTIAATTLASIRELYGSNTEGDDLPQLVGRRHHIIADAITPRVRTGSADPNLGRRANPESRANATGLRPRR